MAASLYGLIVGTIAASLAPGSTSVVISSSDQNDWPDPVAAALSDLYCTLRSADGVDKETVLFTARSANVLTITRAQLGTTALAFGVGARIELVLDSEAAEALVAFWGQFYVLPQNSIFLWHGDITEIPAGWALCDGSNGTPDLRDKFIVGAGAAYNPGDVGGNTDWTSELGGVHDHGGVTNVSVTTQAVQSGAGASPSASTHQHGIPQQAAHAHSLNDILPPYYAAVFIMKL